jgi:hypothetical protein
LGHFVLEVTSFAEYFHPGQARQSAHQLIKQFRINPKFRIPLDAGLYPAAKLLKAGTRIAQ